MTKMSEQQLSGRCSRWREDRSAAPQWGQGPGGSPVRVHRVARRCLHAAHLLGLQRRRAALRHAELRAAPRPAAAWRGCCPHLARPTPNFVRSLCTLTPPPRVNCFLRCCALLPPHPMWGGFGSCQALGAAGAAPSRPYLDAHHGASVTRGPCIKSCTQRSAAPLVPAPGRLPAGPRRPRSLPPRQHPHTAWPDHHLPRCRATRLHLDDATKQM